MHLSTNVDITGYFSRVIALRQCIDKFLELTASHRVRQIVSLGAGFDTTYFHLKVGVGHVYVCVKLWTHDIIVSFLPSDSHSLEANSVPTTVTWKWILVKLWRRRSQ
jgi:hypothetical protein